MSAARRKVELILAVGMLLLCCLSCLCIAAGTKSVEAANRRRVEQLRQLATEVGRTDVYVEGPMVELDGLFGQRLSRIETAAGTRVAFAAAPLGGNL